MSDSDWKKKKVDLVEKYRTHESDTGSPEVQIALLTQRLDRLSGHLKQNKGDKHSERGLLRLVSKRKSLLGYLARTDVNRYRTVVDSLGLRK